MGSEIVGETDPILDSLSQCIQVMVAIKLGSNGGTRSMPKRDMERGLKFTRFEEREGLEINKHKNTLDLERFKPPEHNNIRLL
jgi:hypothetical protein